MRGTAHRVVGPASRVRLRRESNRNVAEREPTLLISPGGKISGYTVGNDMSTRDIEGDNPLYLPQAKVYDGSAAIGPCLVITPELPSASASIQIDIRRAGDSVFSGETTVGRIKRSLPSLA